MTEPGTEAETEAPPETRTDDGTTSGRKLLLHYVELDSEGKPTDACLCGHVWDRVFVKHGDEVCQACVDELRRREQG